MPDSAEVMAVAKAFAYIGAIAVFALLVAAPRLQRVHLPPQRQYAAAWNGWVCLFVFLVFTVPPEVIADILASCGVGPASDPMVAAVYRRCMAKIIALPLQIATCIVVMAYLNVPAYRLRFGPLRRTVTVGVLGWIGITAATYLVNLVTFSLFHLFTGRPPDEHPILRTLLTDNAIGFAWILVAESCLIAPLREELLFRGLIQPRLAQHENGGFLGIALAVLAGFALGGTKGGLPSVAFALCVTPILSATTHLANRGPTWLLPLVATESRRRAAGAIVGTATLFANFHAAVWPTPIPLFVFGLGVGWLAFRTQSLGPSLVVHVLFNSVATASILLR
ncbi:MAG: CPBP family intramembrane glutamic endopeptidase [Gemmataceae bacterium]